MAIVDPGMEEMLETFVHETDSMLEQLDDILLDSERAKSISEDNINTIFRITHTIKGSAAMMGFDAISNLAHSVEDVFYILRENPDKLALVFDALFDLVFKTSDFLKQEMEKLEGDSYTAADPSAMIAQLKALVAQLKGEPAPAAPGAAAGSAAGGVPNAAPGSYRIHVFFEDGCQMENMRAFMLLTQLQPYCTEITSVPEHPENDAALSPSIIQNGLWLICKPAGKVEEITAALDSALNLKSYEVIDGEGGAPAAQPAAQTAAPTAAAAAHPAPAAQAAAGAAKPAAKQSLVSVNQGKLDLLTDLIGELVTAESAVVRNPDLKGQKLDSFNKSARALRKLVDELQDVVMSIRMVPLTGTFRKMERIVRDMSRKLGKEADFVMIGDDTEVDKTINDAIADPLMHMIRNSMDHAIEMPDEREAAGKPRTGKVTLSAQNVGGEVIIRVADDGTGLDKDVLMRKGKERGLLTKPEKDYTEKEIFGFIMLPGFSTNTQVTEFSGRGVGMDVVRKNIESVGGKVSIHSVKGQGTTFTIKIPLTLAIVDGMNLSVGNTLFTLPINTIRQSFRLATQKQITYDTAGTEMILLRGECMPVIRLYQHFGLEPQHTELSDGILIMVESNGKKACLFADELLGEYQVVVKPFPSFLHQFNLKDQGLSGASILGDGSISLILDANSLLE
ncbi:MAG: chemotaxis protein CheA [Faecalibacterium sp.]|jgi:two-component system chemotaxis sensor kinase CheA|nr:chemotaxis protein CheA [Faecalibacterium sp.]